MRRHLSSGALLALWLSAVCLGAEFVAPPAPTRWVTDTTGFLTETTRRSLDVRLEKYERATGHQVIVWIGPDTGGVPLEEWASRTFKAWGIGRKGKDDGVALFLLSGERKLRIEVGYGLEGDLPDAVANRIIQEGVVPALKAGQKDDAITAGVSGILSALDGEKAPAVEDQEATRRVPLTGTQMVIYGILALGLLVLLITHPRLALWFLVSLFTGGGRSSGGRSGGFSGGGGRSGGGGASGSW